MQKLVCLARALRGNGPCLNRPDSCGFGGCPIAGESGWGCFLQEPIFFGYVCLSAGDTGGGFLFPNASGSARPLPVTISASRHQSAIKETQWILKSTHISDHHHSSINHPKCGLLRLLTVALGGGAWWGWVERTV